MPLPSVCTGLEWTGAGSPAPLSLPPAPTVASVSSCLLTPARAVPVNAAFASLPTYQLAYFSAPINRNELVGLLAYHVVAQSVDMANLIPGDFFQTAEGDPVFVQFKEGTCA